MMRFHFCYHCIFVRIKSAEIAKLGGATSGTERILAGDRITPLLRFIRWRAR